MSEIWSKMFTGLHVKYRLLFYDFNETWNVPTVFRKILKYQISSKFVQWEPSCSMRTDGRTDMTKLIGAFRNLANAPKKESQVFPPERSMQPPPPTPISLILLWPPECYLMKSILNCFYVLLGYVISLCFYHNGGSKQGSKLNSRILISFQLS